MHLHFRLITAAVVMCMSAPAVACDICGCSGGANSMGFLPLMQRHFVGARWQSQGFHTNAHGSEPNSQELFHTIDLWGRWQPHRRIQVIGILPWQYNYRYFDNGVHYSVSGLGDVSVQTQIALLDADQQSTRRWQHAIQVGGGVKLPTGASQRRTDELAVLPSALQPGTGSIDYLISALYALRRGAWGISIDGSWRLMGANTQEYRFGNRISTGLRVFCRRKTGQVIWLPYVGTTFDHRRKDRDHNLPQPDTGGFASFAAIGAEVFRNNTGISIGGQFPFGSDMAFGRIKPTPRLSISAVLMFGGKKANPVLVNTPKPFTNIPQHH